MINIVMPMAGIIPLAGELEYSYPSPLVEINGEPLIQNVICNLKEIDDEITFTAILRNEDCKRFHLDSTIKLLTENMANIIRIQKDTAGALCSVLMATEQFAKDTPLIIANTDQIFEKNTLKAMMRKIRSRDPDAACPVFESVHPRWSYVHISDDVIVEAIEKNPVSRNAVAGLYYFKSGWQFSQFAMQAILNAREIDGKYFTSAVLNEYILNELSVIPIKISNKEYHSFFTAQRLLDYERKSS